MSSLRSLLLFGFAALSLAACGEIREDLGLGRNPPDEFSVVERPPLAIPPSYSLRPPRPGMGRPQLEMADDQASSALFGEDGLEGASKMSSSEKALLSSAQVGEAEPNIREIVDRESAQKVAASPHLVDRLLNWSGDNKKPATTVDAEAEAERIKKAKEAGEPLASGATPVIEKQKSGWLGL